jgi:hypothetical protein
MTRHSTGAPERVAADGILVAHEIEQTYKIEAFDLLASAILGAVDHLDQR